MKIPESVDWLLWRPVNARYASLIEVQEHWTLSDVLDAHLILDAIETAKFAGD